MAKEQVLIDKVLNNGYGLGRNQEGLAVFVPNALAGETWQLETVKKKKGTLWATSAGALNFSPIRTEPNCVHFPQCGGCRMLHVQRAFEMDIKLDYLRDVLKRVGKMEYVEIIPHDFPAEESRIRGKFHVDGQGTMGFMGPESNSIVGVNDCYVIPKSVAVLQKNLQAWCARTLFRGEIFFATDALAQGPVVELIGYMNNYKKEPWDVPGVAGISWIDPKGRERWRTGVNRVNFQWNQVQVSLRPSAFFQSNPKSWPLFFELVDSWQKKYQPQLVWDVHAGAGFLSSALENVEGLASEPEPMAFETLLATMLPRGFQCVQGTAEQVIAEQVYPLEELDGAILDPPRTGLEAELCHWLIESGPASLLYISCDMASFARDLQRMAGSYKMSSPVHAMNLNPGTLKLELAVMLERFEDKES